MSFIRNFGHKQAFSQTGYSGRLDGYHKNITEVSRLVQIQNMIQQTNREIKALKDRLNRLEGAGAIRKPTRQKHSDEDNETQAIQAVAPLPITELKHLAEMAKRFK